MLEQLLLQLRRSGLVEARRGRYGGYRRGRPARDIPVSAVLEAVGRMGFETATPVQAATIPPIMAGRDVIGQSETGSGKTAAFCIPAVERIDPARGATQVLILVPTRELATQVAGEVRKLTGAASRIRSFAVYGGGETGCESAEYLTEQGYDVLLVSRSSLKDLARTQ